MAVQVPQFNISGRNVTPSAKGLAAGISGMLGRIREDKQAKAQETERVQNEELFQISFGTRSQAPEDRSQSLLGRAQQARGQGNDELADELERMAGLDAATLDSELVGDISTLGKRLGINTESILRRQNQTQTQSFQANAPIITEQVIDGKKKTFFTALVTEKGTGVQKVVNTPISGELVNKLGLSPGDVIDQKKQEEIVKAEGAANKERLVTTEKRLQKVIQATLPASDKLIDINRGLEILSSTDTGGFASIKRNFGDKFNINTENITNLGELNTILAQDVLAGLSAFTGAISDGERKFIESMSAGIGRGTAVNTRQLKRLKTILERAVRRGEKAAKESGDQFILDELELQRNPNAGAGNVINFEDLN